MFKIFRKIEIVRKFLKEINSFKFKKKIDNCSNNLKIVIGAGNIYQAGWIPSEKEFFNILSQKDWDRYFNKRKIDALMAEHVWEHLTPDKALNAAKLCFEYLNYGGYIRLAVPDGLFPDPDYISYVKPGGYGAGSEDHKALYTYKTFSDIFKQAGFEVELLEYFDENGEFHYKDWNPDNGLIIRSKRFDSRNKDNELKYTSIIIDAVKENPYRS